MAEILRATMELERDHEFDHYCGFMDQARVNSNRVKELLEPKGIRVVRYAGEVSFAGISMEHNWVQIATNGTFGTYDPTLALHDRDYRDYLQETITLDLTGDIQTPEVQQRHVQLAIRADRLDLWYRVLGDVPNGVVYHGEPVLKDKHLVS